MARTTKSAVLHSHPTTPVENLIQDQDPHRNKTQWVLDILLRVTRERRDVPLVDFIRCRLGNNNFTWTGEFRFAVWDRPTYRVFANAKKGLCFEVPYGFTRNQALDAVEQFRKDLGMSNYPTMSGSDIADCEDTGS